MKRVITLFLSLMILVSLGNAAALSFSDFTFRNGIKWYMPKVRVMECLESEADFDRYSIVDEQDESIKEALYSAFPQEKTNPQIWKIQADNISLGSAGEKVRLNLAGTKSYGLICATYKITPNSTSEDTLYDRAKELLSQLSKKYGKFDENDQWKKRKKQRLVRWFIKVGSI